MGLHETFKKPVRERTESPFYLKKKGYGEFMVLARIKFKPRYKRQDVHCASKASRAFTRLISIDPATKTPASATVAFTSRNRSISRFRVVIDLIDLNDNYTNV